MSSRRFAAAPSLVAACLFCASLGHSDAGEAAKEPAIKKGDKVRVINGPAPVKVGEKTLTTVETGTVLEALEVNGDWVKVKATKEGWVYTGWIKATMNLALVPSDPEGITTPASESPPKPQSAMTPTERKEGKIPESKSPKIGVSSWRIVGCTPEIKVPDGRGGYELILMGGGDPPLMVTIELDGTYPGFPDIKIQEDFAFWTKGVTEWRQARPYQIVLPKDIPKTTVGDRTKHLQVRVYLCDFLDFGSLGRDFRGGYNPKSVAVSFKGGPRVPLLDLLKAEKEQPDVGK